MPPKDMKKGKKDLKDDKKMEIPLPAPKLTNVEKQFYELTIADVNKKLSLLRSENSRLEDRNVELEANMKQMNEDRTDVTAYLNRTLNEKINLIADLEDKVMELTQLRKSEAETCKQMDMEWNLKYKTMSEHLTSEIKLLNGP